MATKTKAKPKRKPAPKRPKAKAAAPRRKRASKPKHPEYEVASHPFGPKDKVGIHPAHAVEIERREARGPAPKPLATATVTAKGELKVRLPKGSYAAAAEQVRQVDFHPNAKDPDATVWAWTVFTIK